MQIQRQKRSAALLLLLLLFAASTFIRFALSGPPAVLGIYPDEPRYAMIAESLALGRGATIQYLPTTFQKLLYSFLLAPAYLLPDRVLTMQAVILINSAVLSLGVFPVYWLGRQITGRRKTALLFAALYLLLPDMFYNLLVMSEVLYIPLCLALLCLFWRLFELPQQADVSARRLFLAGAELGFGCWVAYFCKEVALAFVVAYGLCAAYRLWADRTREARRAWVVHAAGYLAGFLLPFLLLKVTLFGGMGNSYNQQSIGALLRSGAPQYLVYSFLYYLGNVLVAFGVFPVVVPLLFYRQMPQKQRRFFAFCLTLAAVTGLVVAYTISIREDFGQQVPRTHLRYLCFLCVPLWMLLCPALATAVPHRGGRRLLAAGAVLCALLPFYHGAAEGSGADQQTLTYMIHAMARLPMWSIRAMMGAAILLGLFLLWRHKKLFLPVMMTGFLALQACSTVCLYNDRVAARQVDPAVYDEVRALRAFVDQHPEEGVLSPRINHFDLGCRLLDTYVNAPNVIGVPLYQLGAQQHRSGMDLTGAVLPASVNTSCYTDWAVDYLLVPDNRPADVIVDESGLELVAEYPHMQQKLYRLTERNHLPLVASWNNLIDGSYTDTIRQPHFDSHYFTADGTFVSGEESDILFFGPYIAVPAGTYTLCVTFDTGDCPAAAGSVIGSIDVNSNASAKDLTVYGAKIVAGAAQAVIDDIELPTDVPDLEIRGFADAPGIRPLTVELVKTE